MVPHRRDLDAGTAYPHEITYTYRGGTLVGGIERKISFQLELRPDPLRLFTGSVAARVRYRVTEIHSTVGASLFRRLVLRYSAPADYLTHRSRIVSAQLFGDDCPLTQTNPEANCDGMPKQTFAYGDAADELASGDVLFAATGVTDGFLLDGVRFRKNDVRTSTVIMRSWSRTVRWITAEHHR